MNNKSDQAYKTIGEVVKLLDLKNRNNKSSPHTYNSFLGKKI